jgi:hypothetical protein
VQLGEPHSSASDWRVRPERPARKDSYRDGNSAGDRRLRSGRRRRDRPGGRRDIHDSSLNRIRSSPHDAYPLAHQGGTVAKADANANRHAPRNAHSLEKRETEARDAEADDAEADVEARDAEAHGNMGIRPGVVDSPGWRADRDARGKAETEPLADNGAHAHGDTNSSAKRDCDP